MTIGTAAMACSTTPAPPVSAKFTSRWQKQSFLRTNALQNSLGGHMNAPSQMDLLCLSHLRWAFVFQRPQHLMSRFARRRRVFFFEEPEFEAGSPRLRERICDKTGVRVCTPVLPHDLDRTKLIAWQKRLLDELIATHAIRNHVAWYYTPMAREFSKHLK